MRKTVVFKIDDLYNSDWLVSRRLENKTKTDKERGEIVKKREAIKLKTITVEQQDRLNRLIEPIDLFFDVRDLYNVDWLASRRLVKKAKTERGVDDVIKKREAIKLKTITPEEQKVAEEFLGRKK